MIGLTEMLWSIYVLIAVVTFFAEAVVKDSVWHGIACGIIWPVFPVVEIIRVIKNLKI
jgi:hypothetical protein